MEQFHQKVQVIVIAYSAIQKDNCVLLLQTNQKRGQFWQNITGTVDPGEDFFQAAKREFQEETALTEEYIKQTTELTFCQHFHDRWNRDVKEKAFLFLLNISTEKAPIVFDHNEHQDFKWIKVNSIKENDYGHISNYQAFEEALSYV